MGDFERTFGAGASSEDIINGFNTKEAFDEAIGSAETGRDDCPKCHGTGRLNQFRHVDNGKCFACGGTGVRVTQALLRTDPVKLEVSLEYIESQYPTHDSFGTLGPEFEASCHGVAAGNRYLLPIRNQREHW